MPKQYNEYTNFYDYHTIHHAKKISDKKELKQYLYDRWRLRYYGSKVNRRTRVREKVRKVPPAPIGITCTVCHAVMSPSPAMSYNDQHLFIYTCPQNHLPKRAFFSNRTEYFPEEHTETINEDIFPPPYIISKKDRRKYCLTDIQAKKSVLFFIDHIPKELLRLYEIAQQKFQKKNDEQYQEQIHNIHFLSIPELDGLLKETLEQLSYTHYESTIELKQEVRLSFSGYAPGGLNEKEVVTELTSHLQQILLPTNCRVENLECRLGVITGIVRVYESEDEMFAVLEIRG